MAIYHLHVKNGSRGGGQSAHAHAQYVSREGKYRRARDALLYRESGHMPAWTAAHELDYWAAADLYERANAQLYKEVEFALPYELSPAAQRDLAIDFAHHLTGAEQLPYTLAIHAGHGTNPHCHLLISERANDGLAREPAHWFKRANRAAPELGGAAKTRTLQPKAWLVATREAWAEHANHALEQAGERERIDHRSLAAQGIARAPGVHLGPHVHAMELRGIQTERVAVALTVDRLTGQIIDLAQLEEGLDHERARLREREIRPAIDGPGGEGPALGDDDGSVAARQHAATQLRAQSQETARLARLVSQVERQTAPWLWGWSRDRWLGVVIGVLATVILGGMTLYWRLGPQTAMWEQLSTYRQLWAVTSETERQQIQNRLWSAAARE